MNQVKIESGIDLSSVQVDMAPENSAEEATLAPEDAPVAEFDDPLEHRALIMECQNYRQHPVVGQKYLSAFDCSIKRLESLSCDELKSLKREMQFVLGAKNGAAFWNSAFFASCSGLEWIGTNFTPLKIQGLCYHLQQTESIRDLIAEIELKHSKFTFIEPEYRLALAVAQTALSLHTSNQARETTHDILKSSADSVGNKYKDL